MAEKKRMGFAPQREEKSKTDSGLVVVDGDLDEMKKLVEETLEIARNREGSERQETDVHMTKDLLDGVNAAKSIHDLLRVVLESGIVLPDKDKEREPLGFHVPKKDGTIEVPKANS